MVSIQPNQFNRVNKFFDCNHALVQFLSSRLLLCSFAVMHAQQGLPCSCTTSVCTILQERLSQDFTPQQSIGSSSSAGRQTVLHLVHTLRSERCCQKQCSTQDCKQSQLQHNLCACLCWITPQQSRGSPSSAGSCMHTDCAAYV